MKILLSEILKISKELLSKKGLSDEEADMVIEHLLESEKSEKPSHGFMRIPRICNRLDNTKLVDIKTTWETPVSSVFDGGNKPGFVVAYKAMLKAMDIADKYKFAMVGCNNSDNTGIIGFYARRLAEKGFISIITTNSPSKIPPHGGAQPIMGTNPLCIGIPTGSDPIVHDFSTAKVTFGDVLLAAKKNELFDEGILLDSEGNPTINPNDVRSGGIGSILSIAGHKGAGLALMLEILSGPLVGAKGGRNAVPEGGWGFFMLVFHPVLLTPNANEFYDKVGKIRDEIKNIQRMNDCNEIFLPGERTNKKLARNKNLEYLDLPNKVYDEILSLYRK